MKEGFGQLSEMEQGKCPNEARIWTTFRDGARKMSE